MLALTEAGRTVLDAATRTFDEVLAAHLGEPLTVDGLTDLGRALGVLRGAIQDADLGHRRAEPPLCGARATRA